MMIMKKNILLSMLVLTVLSCGETTTPKDYIYNSRVDIPFKIYQQDVHNLRELLLLRFDSIRYAKVITGIYKSEYIETEVDTLLYGPSNKIVFLSVSTRKNKYVAETQPNNPEGLDYVGECYIGNKKDSTYTIFRALKYSTGSSQSYERVLKSLRKMYFKEMNYIEDRYNINDIRFWNSSVW